MGLDVNKWTIAIVLLVVALVVAMTFIGSSSKELTDAADSITEANNCSEGEDNAGIKEYLNVTDGTCHNSTGTIPNARGDYDLPLNSLFSSSGVVLLVLMAALLIFLIALSLGFFKKK